MTTEEMIFGTTLSEAVQHIIGRAVRKRDRDAYLTAGACLNGIATLIVFMEVGKDSDMLLKLGNEERRMYQMADNEELRETVHRQVDIAPVERKKQDATV